MEILKLLENGENIDSYTILDFRKWKDGFYYNESYEISLEDVLTIIERTFDSDQ